MPPAGRRYPNCWKHKKSRFVEEIKDRALEDTTLEGHLERILILTITIIYKGRLKKESVI